jgi:hypothetical protein
MCGCEPCRHAGRQGGLTWWPGFRNRTNLRRNNYGLNLVSFFVLENVNDHFQCVSQSGILEKMHIVTGVEALSPCPKICYGPS